MAIDGKLVFVRPADGTGRLVLNDAAESVVQPAEVGVDADFEGDSDCVVQLLWDANVSRGDAIELRTLWQAGEPASARVSSRWQPAQPISASARTHWQAGESASARAGTRWEDSERISTSTSTHWQAGEQLAAVVSLPYQQGEPLRGAIGARWQAGTALRVSVAARYQEAIRMQRAAALRWQGGTRIGAQLVHQGGAGIPVRVGLSQRWQFGQHPPAGLSVVVPPVTPGLEPCYDPATLGRLELVEAWSNSGRLVLVCKEPELPVAGIVVPVRSTYVTINSVTLHRVPSGDEFAASSFNLQVDDGSSTFGWSASLHRSARQHLTRSVPGDRVEVECAVNGVLLRLMIEEIGRDRSFPEHRIAVRGRGLSAELSDADLSFSNPAARTAQQLMLDVLTVNGASLGWTLDWQITDWFIPADRWVFRGSHIEALKDIASAAGAYIQPHPTAKVLRVLSRYPHAPWDWAALLPVDIELPIEATTVVGFEEVFRPDYNRVFVGGVQAPGIFGPVTRGGTAGDKVAVPIVHPLITAAEAHIQRGRAELSNTGVQEHVSVRTLVLPETGIILPGKSLRFVDEDGPRLGLVRSNNLSMDSWPVLHQTLKVETHVQ